MRQFQIAFKRKREIDFDVLIQIAHYLELEALIALCGGASETYEEFICSNWQLKKVHRNDLIDYNIATDTQIVLSRQMEGLKELIERQNESRCLICLDGSIHQTNYCVCCRQCFGIYCFACFAHFRTSFDGCAVCRTKYTQMTDHDVIFLRPKHMLPIGKIRFKLEAVHIWVSRRLRKQIPCIIVTSLSNIDLVHDALLSAHNDMANIKVTSWNMVNDTLQSVEESSMIEVILYDEENIRHKILPQSNINLIIRFIPF